MHALTRAVVGAGGALESVTCQPPLTLRQVRTDDPDTCALCLVGTAAGPLAGDDLTLDIRLRAGARATLTAAGASLSQGNDGARATLRTRLSLGHAASLRAQPGPVIVAEGANVDVAVEIELAADAHLEWRELIVLGRSGEAPGRATLRWDVTRAGRPVLRQTVDLTDPALMAWPGMLARRRVIATALVTGPRVQAKTQVSSGIAVAARLDEHTCLITVLGNDAAEVSRQLSCLSDALASSVA